MVRASMRLAASRSAIVVCSSVWTSCATTSRGIEMQAGKSAHRPPHVWFSGSLPPTVAADSIRQASLRFERLFGAAIVDPSNSGSQLTPSTVSARHGGWYCGSEALLLEGGY